MEVSQLRVDLSAVQYLGDESGVNLVPMDLPVAVTPPVCVGGR
jgi:hypothetical protein